MFAEALAYFSCPKNKTIIKNKIHHYIHTSVLYLFTAFLNISFESTKCTTQCATHLYVLSQLFHKTTPLTVTHLFFKHVMTIDCMVMTGVRVWGDVCWVWAPPVIYWPCLLPAVSFFYGIWRWRRAEEMGSTNGQRQYDRFYRLRTPLLKRKSYLSLSAL